MSKILSMSEVLGIILAGGEGSRLQPLTAHRAKPGVPIAGNFRIIDFPLTNFIRSNIRQTYVLTAYKSDSLADHIDSYWNFLPKQLDEFVRTIPPQKRTGEEWYNGTAEAVAQNKHLISNHKPKIVAIFGGDHVYYMDMRQMAEEHKTNKADVTICAQPMLKKDCPREADGRLSFGIIDVDKNNKVLGFREKPMPEEVLEDKIFVSMGNYMFKTESLTEILEDNPLDFGKHVLPKMVEDKKKVRIYDFSKNEVPGMNEQYEKNFWMDLGTVDAYYDANMMFASVTPQLNLYNYEWAIYKPAAKFVLSDDINKTNKIEREKQINEMRKARRGRAIDSLVSDGVIISGATVIDSVISPDSRIDDYSLVDSSVLFHNVKIGPGCTIKRCIIDKYTNVPPNTRIGENHEEDIARGFYVSPNGITVVPKYHEFK